MEPTPGATFQTRTVAFLSGALIALLVAGTVAFVNTPDPWEPDPAADDRLEDTTADDEPDNTGRPGVCEAADFNSAGEISGVEEIDSFRSRLSHACDQVLAGQTPDRPDLVACFEVTDELGGTTAGLIPQGECEQLAMTAEVTDDLTALVRTQWQDECADEDLRAERGAKFVALCEERAEQLAALPDGS